MNWNERCRHFISTRFDLLDYQPWQQHSDLAAEVAKCASGTVGRNRAEGNSLPLVEPSGIPRRTWIRSKVGGRERRKILEPVLVIYILSPPILFPGLGNRCIICAAVRPSKAFALSKYNI
jgi:hypothetical protein